VLHVLLFFFFLFLGCVVRSVVLLRFCGLLVIWFDLVVELLALVSYFDGAFFLRFLCCSFYNFLAEIDQIRLSLIIFMRTFKDD
jgi:hypothetical protein